MNPIPVGMERLRTLYSVLAGVPDERLDLRLWRNDEKPDCGTIHCAFGWAATYPPFQAMGLHLVESSYMEDGVEIPIHNPHFNGESSFSAAAEFFGISLREAMNLFDGARGAFGDEGFTTDRLEALRRIRVLLEKKGVITGKRSYELALMEGNDSFQWETA